MQFRLVAQASAAVMMIACSDTSNDVTEGDFDGEGAELRTADAEGTLLLEVSNDGHRKVTLKMTNLTDEDLTGTGWRPSASSQLVEATRDGKPLAYLGPIVHRDPAANEWTLLAGQTISQEIDLSNFDVGRGDRVMVAALQASTISVNGDLVPLSFGPAIQVEVATNAEPMIGTLRQELTYETCPTQAIEALAGANLGVHWLADNHLNNWSAASERSLRTTWFGSLADSNAEIVTPLTQIRDLAASGAANLHCQSNWGVCADTSVNAYVTNADIAAGRRNVHFCDRYWSFAHDTGDATGRSRVGVMAHEYAHFFSGIIDHTYNNTASRNLAISNATDAANNANNWRLFFMYVP